MITAKVKCTRKHPGVDGTTAMEFMADYADDRNKEWSKYTPALSLMMTVKDEVAERFKQDQAYTLQFVPSED